MLKWNLEKSQYEPYTIPDDWFCPIYCNDMDEPINCCNCGKKITFGDGFTSRFIQTKVGMGYSVCEDCCAQEREIEDKFNKSRNSEEE